VKVPNNAFASSIFLIGKIATETYQILQQAYGEDAMGRTQVFDCFRRFKEIRTSVESDPRLGRPFFFYSEGIVHHEYAPDGQTINKEFYVEVLRRLPESVPRKRPEKWRVGDWILHYDNAPAQTSHLAQQFLAKHGTAQLQQPPYSPDLAPCDFFLFPRLKRVLKGHRFEANGGHQTKFDEDTIRHPEIGVRKCFQQWQKCWAKCVAAEGNYVEDN